MSSVGKTVKITCGVMDPEGQVIPNSFKNFDWSFDSVRDGEFTSCVSLIEQIQSLFPELASTQVSEIIFLDENGEEVKLPGENIETSLATMKVIREAKDGDQPVPIFIKPISCYPTWTKVHVCQPCFDKLPKSHRDGGCCAFECNNPCQLCHSTPKEGEKHLNICLSEAQNSPEFLMEVKRLLENNSAKPTLVERDNQLSAPKDALHEASHPQQKSINMSRVKLIFKCGLISPDGKIDPDGYKFLSWSYLSSDQDFENHSVGLSHITLAQKVQSVYPEVPEPNRIVFIDEEKDRVAIPCDTIKDTLAALKVMMPKDEHAPIRIFIQQLNPPIPDNTPNKTVHSNLTCAGCKKGPIKGFLYQCLVCPSYNLCGKCDSTGIHQEHPLIRITDSPPSCLSEIKQLMMPKQHNVVQPQHLHLPPEEHHHVKLGTCTIRVL